MRKVQTGVPGGNVRKTDNATPTTPAPRIAPSSLPSQQPIENPTDYGSHARSGGPATGDREVPLSSAMRAQGRQPGSVYAFTEQTPGEKVGSGAKTVGKGFLKMLPFVGNILNGVDFFRKDIPQARQAFSQAGTFGQKLKAAADLAFHGVGMFMPYAGAGYDMMTGAGRMASGAYDGLTGRSQTQAAQQQYQLPPRQQQYPLPEYRFNNGGYPPVYSMPYAQQFPYQPFVQQQPYGYQQYPSYSRYGYPTHPFGSANDGMRGMGRMALGAVKMLPGIGNVANGVDFVNDLRRIGRAVKGDPNHSVVKSAADALFHGLGMIVPQVGGAYDMVQGGVRSTAAAFNPYNYMMSPYGFYGAGYPMMYPMMWC